MRRLLLLTTLAATAASFAPAAQADPIVCVRTMNDKGVEETTCTPYAHTFGDRYCVTAYTGPAGPVTYSWVEVCVTTVP